MIPIEDVVNAVFETIKSYHYGPLAAELGARRGEGLTVFTKEQKELAVLEVLSPARPFVHAAIQKMVDEAIAKEQAAQAEALKKIEDAAAEAKSAVVGADGKVLKFVESEAK